METLASTHKPCSAPTLWPHVNIHDLRQRTALPYSWMGSISLSAHMAAILRRGQHPCPTPLRSPVLFLMMAPSQMPSFTEFLQLGAHHRANLILIIFLHKPDVPILSYSYFLTDGHTRLVGKHTPFLSPASPHTHAGPHRATQVHRHPHTALGLLISPNAFDGFILHAEPCAARSG